ncbi:hypothetical protein [uncultured Ruegeria sp.]|nr:hypothetical protein [uncultured Ruegeria sp.]
MTKLPKSWGETPMHLAVRQSQIEVCKAVGAEVCECHLGEKVGVSQSALDGEIPLNGLRHREENGTTGWYIWGSQQFSEDEGFFKPLHTAHLETKCTLALKFLSLPPGWRFLTDGIYEDVWFDAKLLARDQ